MPSPPFILHATPPLGRLPASDPESLYLAALLQLGAPRQWAITTADYGSNGGKIPYLTHQGHLIRPRHLTSIPTFNNPDDRLNDFEKSDCEAWKAYIHGTLVDLINHSLYSLPGNHKLLAAAQTAQCNWLEKTYISQRIRGIVKTRLQYVGLWGLGGLDDGEATEEDKKRLEEAFIVGPAGTKAPKAWAGWNAGKEYEQRKRLWGEEEIIRRAKAALDPLVRRLGSNNYFFGHSPSTIDLTLFSVLTLILTPNLPNPLIPKFLIEEYPSIISHHERIRTSLFPTWDSIAPIAPAQPLGMYESLQSWWAGEQNPLGKKREKDAKAKAFERARWMWFLGAGVAMVGYLLASGIVRIELGGDDGGESEVDEETIIIGGDDEDVEEEDDEEGEDEEEDDADEAEKVIIIEKDSPLAGLVDEDENEDEE